MAIIADEKWLPSDSIILEKNADVAIRQKRNVLVVAGPGAGKTELLAQKLTICLKLIIAKNHIEY